MKAFIAVFLLFQIEITKGEIKTLKGIKSTDISVKGIRLNDSIEKVIKVFGEPIGRSEEKIFVYPDFLIKFKNGKVNEISFKSSFANSIKGEIENLFKDEIFTDKEMREKLIGEEVKIEVEMIEVSRIMVEKWKIIFKNGFILEGSKKEGNFRFQFLTLFVPENERAD